VLNLNACLLDPMLQALLIERAIEVRLAMASVAAAAGRMRSSAPRRQEVKVGNVMLQIGSSRSASLLLIMYFIKSSGRVCAA
jgi:hypothetical protein